MKRDFSKRLSHIEQRLGHGSKGFRVVMVPHTVQKTAEEQERYLERTFHWIKNYQGTVIIVTDFSKVES